MKFNRLLGQLIGFYRGTAVPTAAPDAGAGSLYSRQSGGFYQWTTDDEWAQVSGGGGGGTPADPDGSIQFNDSGSFGGDANLVWNGSSFVTRGSHQVGSDPTTVSPFIQEITVPNMLWITDSSQTNYSTVGIESSGSAAWSLYANQVGVGKFGIESDLTITGVGGSAFTALTVVRSPGLTIGDAYAYESEGIGGLINAEGTTVSAFAHYHARTMTAEANYTDKITSLYGLLIDDQTGASGQSYAIKTGLGAVSFGDTVQAAGYKSSDGSTGATGSANNTNTLTIKNGLVVGIA